MDAQEGFPAEAGPEHEACLTPLHAGRLPCRMLCTPGNPPLQHAASCPVEPSGHPGALGGPSLSGVLTLLRVLGCTSHHLCLPVGHKGPTLFRNCAHPSGTEDPSQVRDTGSPECPSTKAKSRPGGCPQHLSPLSRTCRPVIPDPSHPSTRPRHPAVPAPPPFPPAESTAGRPPAERPDKRARGPLPGAHSMIPAPCPSPPSEHRRPQLRSEVLIPGTGNSVRDP